jgi:hypothetical protein
VAPISASIGSDPVGRFWILGENLGEVGELYVVVL